jgi:hypothetical protein
MDSWMDAARRPACINDGGARCCKRFASAAADFA